MQPIKIRNLYYKAAAKVTPLWLRFLLNVRVNDCLKCRVLLHWNQHASLELFTLISEYTSEYLRNASYVNYVVSITYDLSRSSKIP